MVAAGAQIYLPVRNRVLIASADPLFRLRVMKKAIFAECDCEQAVGGAHALAKLKQFSCTNVLLDRYLPDLDSKELGKLIQKRYPGITVGFLDEFEPGEKTASVIPHAQPRFKRIDRSQPKLRSPVPHPSLSLRNRWRA